MFDCVLAEKVTSLGKDWHRPCLKCAKCGKVLSSGGHAEVRLSYIYIILKNSEPPGGVGGGGGGEKTFIWKGHAPRLT